MCNYLICTKIVCKFSFNEYFWVNINRKVSLWKHYQRLVFQILHVLVQTFSHLHFHIFTFSDFHLKFLKDLKYRQVFRENYPNLEFFLVHILPYSVQIRKNTHQKKLQIWTLFTQWWCSSWINPLTTNVPLI